MSRVGVLRFLGTNCDRDIWQAIKGAGHRPEWLWYQDQFNADDYQGFILPGGFSYGDYLRCGALAAKAPVMKSLVKANQQGKPILGICNGFQILCDAGLLPGVLVQNEGLRFIDKWVTLNLQNSCPVWGDTQVKKQSTMPIAHGEGRYVVEDDELKGLQDQGQVWWTYRGNPNGSINDIAGVMNTEKNIAGLMPHPERAFYEWMGGDDGRLFFN